MKRIGATEAEVAALENAIAANPTAGDVVQGLGGIRKIRFGIRNRGKRGGGRAIYFLIVADDTVLMLSAYAKNEQKDLTNEQRKLALEIAKGFTDE